MKFGNMGYVRVWGVSDSLQNFCLLDLYTMVNTLISSIHAYLTYSIHAYLTYNQCPASSSVLLGAYRRLPLC